MSGWFGWFFWGSTAKENDIKENAIKENVEENVKVNPIQLNSIQVNDDFCKMILEKGSKLKNILPGPGRNIPDNYEKYKKLLKCDLISICILSEEQLMNKIKNLKKVIINEKPASYNKTPIMEELFIYFEKRNKQIKN